MAPACSRSFLFSISLLAIGLGVVANHWLYAKSNKAYTGTLQVKTLMVRAPVEGILDSWSIEEGTQVDPNFFLCKLVDRNLEHEIQSQQREVDCLDARIKTLQAEVDVKMHENFRKLDGDIYAAELQTADLLQKEFYHKIEVMAWQDAREQRDSSGQQFATIEPVFTPSQSARKSLPLVSEKQIDLLLKEEAAINAVEVIIAQLEICTQRLNDLQAQKKALLSKVQQAVGLPEAKIQLNQAVAELKERQHRQQQQQIYSTEQGTVSNFRQRAGDQIQAGDILADLYQMDDAFVVANVPCSAMHQFALDATVKCLFPNGEKRTGVVTHIAITTEQASSSDKWGKDPIVPIRIEQTGALWPSLPIGGHVGIIR